MANGKYVPNRHGYGYILNAAPDVKQVIELCTSRAAQMARASGGAHAEYTWDVRHGLRRFHGRVASARTIAAYNSERKSRALRHVTPYV